MYPGIGKRYLRDYTDEELRKQAGDLENAVTIPVNVEIRMDERVFDLSEVEKILKQAKKNNRPRMWLPLGQEELRGSA